MDSYDKITWLYWEAGGSMNRKVFTIWIGVIILFFVLFPDHVCEGAKTGLVLWFNTVLPALLPFMILSTFMIRQNITGSVSRIVYPLFHRVMGLSKEGCYPAVIGMLSGYPVGAKTAAQLYQQGRISRQEAQYVLTFCNNASPMFVLEYIGVKCMGLSNPFLLLSAMYLSAYLNAMLYRRGRCFEEQPHPVLQKWEGENKIVSLDQSILDAFVTVTKVGGYIILFTILAKLIEDMLPVSALIKYIGIGILEITTGGNMISGLGIDPVARNTIIVGLCAFGGFSSVAQTASVLSDTDLSIGTYLAAKISQTAIIVFLAILYIWICSLV